MYNIHSVGEGGPRITASFKLSLEPLLRRHTLFGGRDTEMKRLAAFVAQRSKGYLFVTGPSGCGKTALLGNWVNTCKRTGQAVDYTFISRLDADGKAAEEHFTLCNLCQQLASYHDLAGVLPTSVEDLSAVYQQLLTIPPKQGEKLVVVLDGLDEAVEWTPGSHLFPRPLPEGVYVIFSAREIAGREWLDSLELPRQEVQVLELKTLGIVDIAHLLQAVGNDVAKWAEDPAFLKAMQEKSDGDPFYLRYLVEDIRDVPITSVEQLNRQPHGLKGYLDKWWQDVSRAAGEHTLRDLLGYLVVAKDRLTRKDLVRISDEDALDAWVFDHTIQEVQRYVIGDDEKGYALCHRRFQDYVAQERITEHDQQPYRHRLLTYCGRWQEHESRYALRNCVTHLKEAKRWPELFALSRDKAFEVMQRGLFPDEPDLPLKSARIALASAGTLDDGKAMAEFLLVHGHRYLQTHVRGLPLKALREGSVAQAWELTDLYDAEDAPLWYLIVAWS